MNLFNKLIQACLDKKCAPAFTFGGSVLVVGSFFLALNFLYPVYLDDWHYSFNLAGGGRIANALDIIKGQYVHYFEWGGRSVLHAIAQFLLWIGSPWNDILNTAAYICLVLMIYFVANKGNKTNTILFIYINIFIWFTLPSLSQNLIWTTGSANYLWGGLLVFSLLYYYTSFYNTEDDNDSKLKVLGIFLLGILAGWTNENTSIALIFFLIGLIVLLKYQRRKVPLWMKIGLIGVIIGCVVMLLAPGNTIRSKNDLWVAHQLKEADLSFYFYRFVTVTKLAYQYLLAPCLVYLLLLVLYWKNSKKERRKETLFLSLLFAATSAIATIAMSGSPMFPERTWFGILLFLITGNMILYANIDLSNSKTKIANYLIFFVILTIYLLSWKENYTELYKFNEICEQREKRIKAEKEKGITDIEIIDFEFKEEQSPLIVLDLQDWMMIDPGWSRRVGRYYDVNTVTFTKKEK